MKALNKEQYVTHVLTNLMMREHSTEVYLKTLVTYIEVVFDITDNPPIFDEH